MGNIKLSLTQEEFNDLMTVLEEAPYNKVKHLIQLFYQQSQTRHEDASSAGEELKIGERVRARWLKGNTWYNGTIREFKNGQYFIKYDDGDEEWTTREFIESLDSPGSNATDKDFKVGDRVQALWKGGKTWYPGTIKKIKGSKYFIKYDDGDEEWTTTDLMMKA